MISCSTTSHTSLSWTRADDCGAISVQWTGWVQDTSLGWFVLGAMMCYPAGSSHQDALLHTLVEMRCWVAVSFLSALCLNPSKQFLKYQPVWQTRPHSKSFKSPHFPIAMLSSAGCFHDYAVSCCYVIGSLDIHINEQLNRYTQKKKKNKRATIESKFSPKKKIFQHQNVLEFFLSFISSTD